MFDVESDIIEAGALLGATINRYGTPGKTISPPKGTHSSFAIQSPTPSSDLMSCLYSLRALLRSAPRDTPLVAAPSILQVLMKLLGVSSNLAPSPSSDPSRRTAIPPMLSTPLRKLWVDCVVLCHVLGEGLSGNSRINTHGFVRNMIQLAGMNPRTAKAAGGTRIAALEVISGIIKDEKLARQMSNWGLDIVQLCQRALKSFGSGEPSYRISGIETACAAAISSRISFLATRPGINPLLLKGALEDKVIVEMVRLLKTAVADKYPEIRQRATCLASILAPLAIHTSIKSPNTPDATASSPTSSLEDIMTIAFKNLDDESAHVAAGWAETIARCMCTSIEYHKLLNAQQTSNRDVEGDGASPGKASQGLGGAGSRTLRKGIVAPASSCSTLPKALNLLVDMFVNIGGELTPPQSSNGTYSIGGRAIRNGFARAMIELLRQQSSMQRVGEGKCISQKEAITIILSMVGGDFEVKLSTHVSSAPASNLFGAATPISPGDGGLARLAAARVLREGLSILSSESTQISILHALTQLCGKNQASMKGNQLQVILIEISHLLSALGDATASAAEDLIPALKSCLRHPDEGVRHEAAVACAALASAFPFSGRQMIHETISEIQIEHAELMATSSNMPKAEARQDASLGARFSRFRRTATPTKEIKVDESAKHKRAIHGMTLMISVVMRDLPNLPGGIPTELIDRALSIAEILVNTIFNDVMTGSNPGGTCDCVKGGFAIICGSFAAGVEGIRKHIPTIFSLWQKLVNEGSRAGYFADADELVCVKAMLGSIVSFLRYCSELLLTVPDALAKTSLLLEEMLPWLFPDGKLGRTQNIRAAAAHLDSAKAAILEAFAWLPPGSYPMVADSVFDFSASSIQMAISNEIPCSILRLLVSNEDVILDSMSFSRAKSPGQVGGAVDLENDLITLTAEIASHSDRESVLHLLKKTGTIDISDSEFLGSQVLGTIVVEESTEKAPTPLHEVGTWRRPVTPSCSAKVRLVDASIQAFAATFTLKSGKEQQMALQMLESLLPPAHLQSQRTGLSEQGRRGKNQDDTAAATNITAVLLFCLKALPVFESTHNVPIQLGPQWMNKAKDVFRALLRSPSQEIRRAAAEGLAFLSTLGVREDARFLQSAVLHDLDAVIQGTNDQEQGKQLSIESVCAGRSAAVLALSCMQRTASRIQQERRTRAQERGSVEKGNHDTEEILPLFQILIKILPSITIRPTGGFLGVRAVGMHAFGLLFSYSRKIDVAEMSSQELHLLKKLVELVEDNFLSAWTAASSDFDHGTDEDKLTTEVSFVAVLLRLMTFLTPKLCHMDGVDERVALRFARMSSLAVECFGSHPTVRLEAMAFHEVLSQHQHLLPAHEGGVKYDEHAVLCCIPMLMESITPPKFVVHLDMHPSSPRAGMASRKSLRAAVKVVRFLSISNILVAEWSGMEIIALLFTALEDSIGSQTFAGNTLHRGLSAPRDAEILYRAPDSTARELSQIMSLLVLLERKQSSDCLPILLRYILLSRCILTGLPGATDDDEEGDCQPFTVTAVVRSAIGRASADARPILEYTSLPRWQVKVLAIQVMAMALRETALKVLSQNKRLQESFIFNPKLGGIQCATACREAQGLSLPSSLVSLHLRDIITAACGMATATVDQVELRCLQESAMYLIRQIVECFGAVPDPDQHELLVLNEDIPQLSAAIKNALSAPEDDDDANTCRLFFSGSQALESFLRMHLTNDKGVLKRIFRPVVPVGLLMFGIDETLPVEGITGSSGRDGTYSNNRSNLLLHIGRLLTIGNVPPSDSDLLTLVNVEKSVLGAHAASLAIDGARFVLNEGLTFGGRGIRKGDLMPGKINPCYLASWNSIDDTVKAALVSTWSKLASVATAFLTDALESSDNTEAAEAWLRSIVPFLFAGFMDAISARNAYRSGQASGDWGIMINPTEVITACLTGMKALSAKPNVLSLDSEWKPQVESTLSVISKCVFEPILSGKLNLDNIENEMGLVETACSLLLQFTEHVSSDMDENSPLLHAIMRPLSLLEENQDIDSASRESSVIISTCMSGAALMASSQSVPPKFIYSMIKVALNISAGKNVPSEVRAANMSFLKECLEGDTITIMEQTEITRKLAESNDWEGWCVAVKANEGAAAQASLSVVQENLLACIRVDGNLPLLRSLQVLLQASPAPNDFVGRIVSSTIAEVLVVFQAYATYNVPADLRVYRSSVCADGMKVALIAIQQWSNDGSTEDDLAHFLHALFQVLIASIRYNGLPNNPVPNPGSSDPAVGRMCAQAITHIARVAPAPFKSSMALMPDADRSVLEVAVRAEMSGYASASTEAVSKKKLSLKGFKK